MWQIATGPAAGQLLADNNFGDTRSGGLAGPTGLVIILLLGVATVLLIRSMNSHLRRLPERFEPPPEPPGGRGRRAGGERRATGERQAEEDGHAGDRPPDPAEDETRPSAPPGWS